MIRLIGQRLLDWLERRLAAGQIVRAERVARENVEWLGRQLIDGRAGRSIRSMHSTTFQPGSNVAPVIETERLRLRPHQSGDLADCVAMWSDPAVVRYTIGEPSPPQRTWIRILAYGGHWAMLSYGYWAVEEKTSGRYIGELGFADFKREIVPSIEGIPELGWALAPQFHGKGYATEALKAAVVWGDRHFSEPRTVCIIHRDNHRSLRVAEKLGYKAIVDVRASDESGTLLARPA
jgi:RimJ/RimL family protein N-acetyltransferase